MLIFVPGKTKTMVKIEITVVSIERYTEQFIDAAHALIAVLKLQNGRYTTWWVKNEQDIYDAALADYNQCKSGGHCGCKDSPFEIRSGEIQTMYKFDIFL